MQHAKITMVAIAGALASTAGTAADRLIAVAPALQMSWEFVTPGSTARLRPRLGVGFWQRASGAKPGVGAHYVSALEYQLPEAAPARVRSARFQFSGRPSQCAGTEPVVIVIYAYAADGKANVNDAMAGSRVAQVSADCNDTVAFVQPIDVTAIVRQQIVASGVRHVGFNIREGNHRQGPGLFELSAGKLTVVLSDQAVVPPSAANWPQASPLPGGAAARQAGAQPGVRTTAAATPLPKPKRQPLALEQMRSNR